ncbi:hypothetical protein Ancab_012558 [Ancistrocladus abbreviatus]
MARPGKTRNRSMSDDSRCQNNKHSRAVRSNHLKSDEIASDGGQYEHEAKSMSVGPNSSKSWGERVKEEEKEQCEIGSMAVMIQNSTSVCNGGT